MSQDELQKYKSLLVVNESEDADVTLHIYSGWSRVCKVPTVTEIIEPKQKYFHHEENLFKFQLVADKQKKKDLLGPLTWDGDKLITIIESLDSLVCIQEHLTDFPNEKRVCLRKIHRTKELAVGADEPNLYQILGLDMKQVRKMETSALKKTIKDAYRNQMRIWHPDKNFGNGEIAIQINLAKEILLDDEKRASYHNGVDYDKGRFSFGRWKAIFWPECNTKEQNKAFWRRIGLAVTSLLVGIGAVSLTVCTGGIVLPVAVALGSAAWESLKYALSRESVLDGCQVKIWALEAGKGFALGTIGALVSRPFASGIAAACECGFLARVFARLRTGIKFLDDAIRGIPKKLIECSINRIIKCPVEYQHPLQHVDMVTNVEMRDHNEPPEGMIRCRSEGCRLSKMIVTFYLYGEKCKTEVIGDGACVLILEDATDIEVRLQVKRLPWGDVMKYDRFKKAWCEPSVPHIFRYETPPVRTFTISGSPRWEAVMRVSDEYHEETKEMC